MSSSRERKAVGHLGNEAVRIHEVPVPRDRAGHGDVERHGRDPAQIDRRVGVVLPVCQDACAIRAAAGDELRKESRPGSAPDGGCAGARGVEPCHLTLVKERTGLDIHPGRAKSVAAAIPSGRERIRRREGLRGHVVAVQRVVAVAAVQSVVAGAADEKLVGVVAAGQGVVAGIAEQLDHGASRGGVVDGEVVIPAAAHDEDLADAGDGAAVHRHPVLAAPESEQVVTADERVDPDSGVVGEGLAGGATPLLKLNGVVRAVTHDGEDAV